MNASAVRILVAILALFSACGKKSSAPSTSQAYRFLPANPELVVKLDLPRVRAWPHYDKLASAALGGVDMVLKGAREQCQLDVLAEAKDVILAKRGPLLGGDLTVIASGLPREKVTGCLAKILAASTPMKLKLDGDLVDVKIGERSIASAAILPSGEVVLVARDGQGVEPSTWKTEVTQGAIAVPAWVSELDTSAPVAVRTHDEARTVAGSVQLGDPLVLKGTVTNPTPEAAQREVKNLSAIAEYLKKGDAGVGRVEPSGTTTRVELTATGKQIDNFLAIVGPTLFAAQAPPPPPADPNAPPPDCNALGPAVKTYLDASLAKAPPANKATLEAQMPTLAAALQQAFISSCTTDRWAAAAIECHVTNASALARFEKCRQMLADDERARLDQAVAAALSAKK
ncbi:MAG: hypothetical protein SFX73_02740 [Kofleriaceae bacterium]|nr:hypothetical protein [Kofleriaceae bacterium]